LPALKSGNIEAVQLHWRIANFEAGEQRAGKLGQCALFHEIPLDPAGALVVLAVFNAHFNAWKDIVVQVDFAVRLQERGIGIVADGVDVGVPEPVVVRHQVGIVRPFHDARTDIEAKRRCGVELGGLVDGQAIGEAMARLDRD